MKMFGEELSSQEKAQIQEQAKQLEHKLTKVITIAGSRKKVDKIDISKLEIKEIVLVPSDIDRDKYVRLGSYSGPSRIVTKSKIDVIFLKNCELLTSQKIATWNFGGILIISTPQLNFQSMKSLATYLQEDIRFDMSVLESMDKAIITQCATIGKKRKSLELLLKLISR